MLTRPGKSEAVVKAEARCHEAKAGAEAERHCEAKDEARDVA